MKFLTYEVKSHIPGTREWKSYRDTCAWIEDSIATLRLLSPEIPAFPCPIPRNEEAIRMSLESVLSLLRFAKAKVDGNEAVAAEWSA